LRWDSWEGQMRRNGCRRNQNSHGQQRSWVGCWSTVSGRCRGWDQRGQSVLGLLGLHGLLWALGLFPSELGAQVLRVTFPFILVSSGVGRGHLGQHQEHSKGLLWDFRWRWWHLRWRSYSGGARSRIDLLMNWTGWWQQAWNWIKNDFQP
jgi:hypothetical protein